jgi:O-antigen ligase
MPTPCAFFEHFSRPACFTLLAIALGYAVLDQGGQDPIGWNVALLILGAGAIPYLLVISRADRPPFIGQMPAGAVLLPSAYVAFQLLPLPVRLLKILSPARAKLAESLAPITNAPSFAPISIDPGTTSIYLLRTLAYSLAALLIYEISRQTWRRRPWTPVIPLVVIAAFEACLGIVQFANGGDVAGTYRSRNHFAGPLEMVMPLALVYGFSFLKSSDQLETLQVSRALKACAVFALAASMLVGLVYSISKMGFSAGLGGLFAISALAVFFQLNGLRRWLAAAGVTVSMLLIFLFLPTNQLAGSYAGFAANDPASVEGRAPIWHDSRQLLSAYPVFGTGLGTYQTAILKYQTSNLDLDFTFAHNDYIELASELGALGFLIFGGLLMTALVKAVRAAGSADWNTHLLGLGCTGALTAIGIHSLADFNLYIPANALLLSWIAGLALSIPSPSLSPSSHDGAKERTPPNVIRSLAQSGLRTAPILFACLLVCYAAAWIVFETKYAGDLRMESVFCRFGICGADTVLAAEARSGGNPPLPFLVEAVKREPAAPHRWCDLGDALLRHSRAEEARYCFSNALALGPEIPPILLRSASFYHAVHEDERALQQGASLLEKSEVYQASIFDWYRDQKFSLPDILSRGLPPGPLAARSYLHYWTGLGDPSSAKISWEWILAHQYADLPTAREYMNFLFGNGEYQEACANWALFLGNRRNGYRQANWIFNGDFETEPAGVPLDWDIGSAAGLVATALDSSVAHTGSRSLRIRFAGTENVSYAASERTSVPRGAYRFAAYIRTQDITTDKGIAFRIFDPEDASRLDARTEQFVGTTGWKKVEQTVRVQGATKLLEIQVIREPSMKFDNRVSGTAWIDSISLSRIE